MEKNLLEHSLKEHKRFPSMISFSKWVRRRVIYMLQILLIFKGKKPNSICTFRLTRPNLSKKMKLNIKKVKFRKKKIKLFMIISKLFICSSEWRRRSWSQKKKMLTNKSTFHFELKVVIRICEHAWWLKKILFVIKESPVVQQQLLWEAGEAFRLQRRFFLWFSTSSCGIKTSRLD